VRLFRPVGPWKKDRRIGAEFVNDLTARTAGRTGQALVVGHSDRANLDPGPKLRDGRENRRAFGAVGHSVGGILHIASREDFAVREENGGSNAKFRVRRVRVLHDFLRGP